MNFEELLSSFKVHNDLNRTFWGFNDKLDPKIRSALIGIAMTFYNTIDVENKPEIKDIVFTGSLANYNYSRFSDVDLHLLFDFEAMGEHKEHFEKIFALTKTRWNDLHDIKIKGYEVEIYTEDFRNPHISTGLYSVKNDTWIKSPEKKTPVFDELDVKSKLQGFINLYKELLTRYKQDNLDGLKDKIEALQEKIRKYRQSGLEKGGEFSVENITFKLMRRIKLLDKIAALKVAVIDKKLSVENKKI